jgi:hypothetical protein
VLTLAARRCNKGAGAAKATALRRTHAQRGGLRQLAADARLRRQTVQCTRAVQAALGRARALSAVRRWAVWARAAASLTARGRAICRLGPERAFLRWPQHRIT